MRSEHIAIEYCPKCLHHDQISVTTVQLKMQLGHFHEIKSTHKLKMSLRLLTPAHSNYIIRENNK